MVRNGILSCSPWFPLFMQSGTHGMVSPTFRVGIPCCLTFHRRSQRSVSMVILNRFRLTMEINCDRFRGKFEAKQAWVEGPQDWGSGSVCKAQGKHETLNSDPQLQCQSAWWCTSVLLALGTGWGNGKRDPCYPGAYSSSQIWLQVR